MRIAYVTIHVAPEIVRGGVGKKIQSQTKIWRETGHEVALFSLTPAEIPFPEERQFIFEAQANLLKRETARASELKRMLVAIRAYRPDIIYLRFGLYSYPLHRLFKIAPVVLETNSDDRQEYKKRGAFFHWMNRITRGLIFGSAAGIITPSHELVDVLLPRREKPFCVISNGVDLSQAESLPAPKNASPVITLVGSPGMDWHGVDKLIQFAEIFSDLTIQIAGYSRNDIDIPSPTNVHFLGFLYGGELRKALSKTDVACGTLALHRKKMNEASPLKVREALAFGIPVIIAYRDTDLDEMELDTILRIPNTENNVVENAERIRQFAHDMMGKRVDVDVIFPHLDQRKKEERRLAFFEEVLSGDGL
ncbi:MAG TPA: glycosyltransferase family 4 protein [Anaerolineales bacterium]|nr:glycosyltransferase family 4 protein [Anaerolineales bacterium]